MCKFITTAISFLFIWSQISAQESTIVNFKKNNKEKSKDIENLRIVSTDVKNSLPDIDTPILNSEIIPQNSFNIASYNKFSHTLYHNTNTLSGFGYSYEAGGTMYFYPSKDLKLSLSIGGTKYSINGLSFNDFFLDASLTFQLNSWLKLYLYGQYTFNSKENAFNGGFYLSPQCSYGTALLVKISDRKRYSVDLNLGVESTFNPLRNKWEFKYNLCPQIRIK
ncbi:MAG: hypothetical protein PHH48_05925 [Eubacteriales bacterium]|nr:hypothetical protein [Eubacteriales bacterium]